MCHYDCKHEKKPKACAYHLPEEKECALAICDQSCERCTRMSVAQQNQSFPPYDVELFFRDSIRATLSH
jgi:hypothetical protein